MANLLILSVEYWANDSLSLPDEPLNYYIKFMKLEEYDGFENNLKTPLLENLRENLGTLQDLFDQENGAVVKAFRQAYKSAQLKIELRIVANCFKLQFVLLRIANYFNVTRLPRPPVTPNSSPQVLYVVENSPQAPMSNKTPLSNV